MAEIRVVVAHRLSQTEARDRIQYPVDAMLQRFGSHIGKFRQDWNGRIGTFSGSANGRTVSGTIRIYATKVEVTAEVSRASFFERAIAEREIRKYLERILR